MKDGTSRRTFLKGATSAASLLALTRCTPGGARTPEAPGLDPSLLRSLAEAVLPSELGEGGRERAVMGFEAWLAGYEPVPELMHGYGSQEIRYGPGDPAPRWGSQLTALDIEAERRWSQRFVALEPERRRQLVRRHLAGTSLQRLSSPVAVEHVGAALLAYWLSTSEAVNLCYRRSINARMCRPLAESPDEPIPLRPSEG